MISPVLFTFQIILLALGFGVGYLFLLKAQTQEPDLKNIGVVLGWTLIVATIILELFSFPYSLSIVTKYSATQFDRVNNVSTTQEQYQQQQKNPDIIPSNGPNATTTDDNSESDTEYEAAPIKNDTRGPGSH